MGIHLLSFADGTFSGRTQGFISEATVTQSFDSVTVDDLSTLPAEFVAEHGGYMSGTSRGFGYWIWKPVVIRRALQACSSDDVLIYSDIGCTINPSGHARLMEYCDITRSSPFNMLSFQDVHTEKRWTKMDLARRLSVDRCPHIMSTSQLPSGLILMQKTSSNLDLLAEWEKIAVEENYRFSDDSASLLPNDDSFVEHRHDQSIFSILRKVRGTSITYYEAEPNDHYHEPLRPVFPFWATRSKR